MGRHNISIGASFERRRLDIDNGFQSPGVFTFNGSFSGLGLSDFVLGDLYQLIQAKGQFENARVWGMGFYVQDNYKVTSRLTLNLGLRWEPYLPWHETKGRVEGFSMQNYSAGIVSQVYTNALPGLLFRGDPGFPENGTGSNFKDFAPRVGFAWDVSGDGKTSIRGGAGLFYDSYTIGILNNNMVSISPFAINLTLTPPPGPFSNPLAGLPQYANVLPGVFPPPKDVAFPLPVSAQTFNLAARRLPGSEDLQLEPRHRTPARQPVAGAPGLRRLPLQQSPARNGPEPRCLHPGQHSFHGCPAAVP